MMPPQFPSRIYREQGFAVIDSVFDAAAVAALRDELSGWTEQSRRHNRSYGRLPDGRSRFDLEPGHSADAPKLRRVANPCDISARYADAVFGSVVGDMLLPLLGPNIKFDHCKLNVKLPGMNAAVAPHQDHAFEPQTNDDVVVTLLLLDDMTPDNGCLRILPGSQRERHSHYHQGHFTGVVGPRQQARFAADSVPVCAPAGSVIFMDTWALHGSASNHSDTARRLFITEYKAADAFPLTPHKIPSRYAEQIVRGRPANRPRYRLGELGIELPPHYRDTSVFALQAEAANAAAFGDAAAG